MKKSIRESIMASLKISVRDARESLHIPQRFGEALEARRWVILLAYFLFSTTSAMSVLTYTPVLPASIGYYSDNGNVDIEADDILLTATVPSYCFFALSYIGAYLTYKRFQATMLIVIFLNALGAWIRYAAGTNYNYMLIGQTILGVAAAPIGAMGPHLAERWFAEKERFLAMSCAMVSNALGFALGYLVPCAIVGDNSSRIPVLNLVQAISMTLPFLIGLPSIKERPLIPPSYTALYKQSNDATLGQEICTLAKNTKFWLMCILFGSVIGSSIAVSIVLEIYLEPLNLSNWAEGLVGALYLGSGFVAAGLGTFIMEAGIVKKVDYLIRFMITLGVGSGLYLSYLYYNDLVANNLTLYLLILGMGCGLNSVVPFIISSLIESTYPVQEPLSVNFLLMMGQIFNPLVVNVGSDPDIGNWGFAAVIGFAIPGWLYSITFFKTDYKQAEEEKKHRQIADEDVASILTMHIEHPTSKDVEKLIPKLTHSMFEKPNIHEKLHLDANDSRSFHV